MVQRNKIEVLALLEAYRIKAGTDRESNTDTAIRVCQAIIAKAYGFDGRAAWTDGVMAAGLIDYGHEVDVCRQYKNLTALVENINEPIHNWQGPGRRFDYKGKGRIFTDSEENVSKIREIIRGIDEDEYEYYLPADLVAVYQGQIETVYTGKFDSFELSGLLERCRQEGIPCRVVKMTEECHVDIQSAEVGWPCAEDRDAE
jgi:hypothetical protein